MIEMESHAYNFSTPAEGIILFIAIQFFFFFFSSSSSSSSSSYFFTSALADGLSQEFEIQQVSTSPQDSSQYSDRSQ